jgi:hypothetical protein
MKRIPKWLCTALLALIAVAGYASSDNAGVMSLHPSPSPSGAEVVFSADFDGGGHLWISAFPKGVNISGYSQAQLNAIARKLNERPRKTLDFRTPAARSVL